jgi:nucleotide-binding universal stress UspA family protein
MSVVQGFHPTRAYTQSRLREWIFGGATRHIVANATLPVLMAH